jgi:hypothetical protein
MRCPNGSPRDDVTVLLFCSGARIKSLLALSDSLAGRTLPQDRFRFLSCSALKRCYCSRPLGSDLVQGRNYPNKTTKVLFSL